MTIAEVGKIYDLTPDTLRYYERIGLIPKVTRNASGNRDYQEKDCNWVSFIKCMRNAGLSIEVLIEYVAMFQAGDDSISARKDLLIEQKKQLKERIEELQQTLQYLEQKIEHYEDNLLRCESKLKTEA